MIGGEDPATLGLTLVCELVRKPEFDLTYASIVVANVSDFLEDWLCPSRILCVSSHTRVELVRSVQK